MWRALRERWQRAAVQELVINLRVLTNSPISACKALSTNMAHRTWDSEKLNFIPSVQSEPRSLFLSYLTYIL
jgi:hypothetical protein